MQSRLELRIERRIRFRMRLEFPGIDLQARHFPSKNPFVIHLPLISSRGELV